MVPSSWALKVVVTAYELIMVVSEVLGEGLELCVLDLVQDGLSLDQRAALLKLCLKASMVTFGRRACHSMFCVLCFQSCVFHASVFLSRALTLLRQHAHLYLSNEEETSISP